MSFTEHANNFEDVKKCFILKQTTKRPKNKKLQCISIHPPEKWANIATSRCATLMGSYPKRLTAVIAVKEALQSTDFRGMNS